MSREYQLKPGETFILKEDRVSLQSRSVSGAGELILTTKSLVFMKSGLFKTEEIIFPLSSVCVFNGKAQVEATRKDLECYLEIYLENGSLIKIRFDQGILKQKAAKWADAISIAATGNPLPEENKATYAIPGMDILAKYAAGTVDTFKDAFGIKKKGPQRCVKECSGCGASLEIVEGTVTVCPYCDTKNYM